MSMRQISIIVPAYNSTVNLAIFLESFEASTYKDFEIIINDDKRTNDNTAEVVQQFSDKLAITHVIENQSMAQARKQGATHAKGDILLHLDTDMKVTPKLLEECVKKINEGYDALVIPEESYGTTFWAKCKWLEKKCYDGDPYIESLRCVTKSIYDSVGGHNEHMVFSEDKDLDLRVHQTGCKVGRTSNFLLHNEGNLKLLVTLRKKSHYSKTANLFAETHPEAFRVQSNLLRRYTIYAKNGKYLLSHPVIYVGMIFMKTAEFGAGAFGYARSKFST